MAVPSQSLCSFYTFLLALCTSCFVFSSHHRHLSLLSSALLLLGTWMLIYSKLNRAQNGWHDSNLHRNTSSKVEMKVRTTPAIMETETTTTNRRGIPSKLRRSLSLITVPSRNPEPAVPRRDLREGRPPQERPNDRVMEAAAVSTVMPHAASVDPSPGRDNILAREPSLSAEVVKQLADAFIERFHERMRLERQNSYQTLQQNILRQKSYQRYKDRLDRSAG